MYFFRKKMRPKKIFPYSYEQIRDFIIENRETLSVIENWIDEKSFNDSIFNYGVPDFIKTEINKEINHEITYSDLISFISNSFFEKVNYLEIGVSLGKNFFQVVSNVNNLSQAFGFDIEEIYPILEQKLIFHNKSEWEPMIGSLKSTNSSLKEYTFNNNLVNYISADVWDEASWKKLCGRQFNVIFSDALHTPEAILFEFEMIMKYNLLADRFVIIWDDLVGVMQKSFHKIIEKYNAKINLKDAYLLNVNGWVGQYEEQHTIGIISNFTI